MTGLYQDILHAVKDLLTCAYTSEMFLELLSQIQAMINRLNLEGYTDTNLEHWVAELDKQIEGILLQWLAHIIQVWCSEFDCTIDEEEPPMISLYTKSDASATVKLPMVISAFLSSVSVIVVTTLPNYILVTPSCTMLPYMFNTSVPVMFGEIIASKLATSTHAPILVSPTMNISGTDYHQDQSELSRTTSPDWHGETARGPEIKVQIWDNNCGSSTIQDWEVDMEGDEIVIAINILKG
ncbi:hypothetical protein F5141DRAFT_1220919 [Pisolithus sp. B1]|nr:hypothetical protein F5141DRAFT_1220919 [Pisolithus sp. B1]